MDEAGPEDRGRVLLQLARASLEQAFGGTEPEILDPPGWLSDAGATFVTLLSGGLLRGCVGTLEARRPLVEDVRANARAAAFEDPRFPPLRSDELSAVSIEVSLLRPPEEILFETEEELLRSLQPGIDGLILEAGGKRATFLPKVWEKLADRERFLAQLKRKAGIGPAEPGLRAWRYRVESWSEAGP